MCLLCLLNLLHHTLRAVKGMRREAGWAQRGGEGRGHINKHFNVYITLKDWKEYK